MKRFLLVLPLFLALMGLTQATGCLDGASGAQPTNPQYPRLLDGYSVRPPWPVAGVDYGVGPPTNFSFRDPLSRPDDSCAAKHLLNGSHYLTVVGDNCSIGTVDANGVCTSGYDFSLEGGWNIDVVGNNVTIQCNKWIQYSTGFMPVILEYQNVGATIRYNTFKGNGTQDVQKFEGPLVKLCGTGTVIFEYNYVYDAYNDGVNACTPDSGTLTLVFMYNVIANMGDAVSQAHPDFLQYVGRGAGMFISDVEYNLCYQPDAPLNGGSQGLTLDPNVGGGVKFGKSTLSNNTLVSPPPSKPLVLGNAGVATWLFFNGELLMNGVVANIQNNYFDPRGNLSTNGVPGYSIRTVENALPAGNVINSGNTNMVTGRSCDIPYPRAPGNFKC